MIDGLPTATLTGADSELSIQIWLDNADDPFMWLNANLKTTGSNLKFDQTIEKTGSYDFRSTANLKKLIAGDSSARFEFLALHFDLMIYEHQWGVRYGYIAEGFFSTIKWDRFSPWPKRLEIGDYLLDDDPSAGCLKFAFVSQIEDLRRFAAELDSLHRNCLGRIHD